MLGCNSTALPCLIEYVGICVGQSSPTQVLHLLCHSGTSSMSVYCQFLYLAFLELSLVCFQNMTEILNMTFLITDMISVQVLKQIVSTLET